jgi:DMSO/TMAO reductase YedYZ heme-binding membrane subunit
MIFLIRRIRIILYTTSILIAVGIYLSEMSAARLDQVYALLAITFLYFALLASPLYSVWPNLPWRPVYIQARQALGVSAFFYGLIHAYISFFDLLGGFEGLPFLSSKYLIAISLSATSLLILAILAATSPNRVHQWLRAKWKPIHRFVYLAGIFIIIHALMLGDHFVDLSQLIPQIAFYLLAFLFILEAIRFDKFYHQRFPNSPRVGLALVLTSILITIGAILMFFPSFGALSLNIHANHLANIQQQNGNQPISTDTSKKYSVSFIAPENPQPGKPVALRFKVHNILTGAEISKFYINQEKLMHMVVVSNDLTYFEHTHPQLVSSDFTISTTFPANDLYHIYLNFFPEGGSEQQFAFSYKVGNPGILKAPAMQPDATLEKTFGQYKVAITGEPFLADDMTGGTQILKYLITDTSGLPITNLEQYLGSFGHLILINEQTYEYIHIHPVQTRLLAKGELGGPEVNFVSLALSGRPITPGVYKAFGEFKHNSEVFVTNFTITLQ